MLHVWEYPIRPVKLSVDTGIEAIFVDGSLGFAAAMRE
jgi:hypothetical protein